MRFTLILTWCCLIAPLVASAAVAIPPGQPSSGPGGADYRFAGVASHQTGSAASDVTIFWPKDAEAKTSLPVVVFTHGWGALTPVHYQAWLDHIVRKGAIVLYPHYQDSLRTKPEAFTPNAVAGVRQGLEWLSRGKELPTADLSRVAVVGHSAGGVLAINLALALPRAGVNGPKAVMCVEPAVIEREQRPLVPLENLKEVPASVWLLTISGEDDALVGDEGARRIYEETTSIPATQKDWLELRSDHHGSPALLATHRAPAAPHPGYQPPKREEPKGFIRKRMAEKAKQRLAERGLDLDNSSREPAVTDTLDYYGTWRLFDALCAAAFEDKMRDVAFGGGAAQLDMGKWSDGTPVVPLRRRSSP